MATVGTVAGVWRYPVKSMAGEEMALAFVGFGGVHGDRLHAFGSAKAHPGFPYATGRENRAMVTFRPRWRHPERALLPPNLEAALALDPDIAAAPASAGDMALDVELPDGRRLPIDDPALAEAVGADGAPMRSDRAITDCRPVSLFSLQSAATLGAEIGRAVDVRRFRANLVLDLEGAEGFAEDGWVGRTVRIGETAVLHVVGRDPRCAMITLDPDTGERDFDVLKTVTANHEGRAGIYAAAIAEGVVRPGDAVTLAD